MVDERTLNQDYPLPHCDNLLSEDVARLRTALSAVDQDVAMLEAREAVPAPSQEVLGFALVATSSGHVHAPVAPEPSPDPISLGAPNSATGAASWTVSGYPAGFGAARVEVAGDIEVAVGGGSFGTARTSAGNGDVVTVRPIRALVDGQSYSGTLRVGAATVDYSFTFQSSFIPAPNITGPLGGAGNIGPAPTITASAYDVLPGSGFDGANPHLDTDWQIATDAGFTTIVWSSMADATNKTSVIASLPAITVDTTYYIRCRYRSASMVSGWSASVSVSNQAPYLAQPSITAPANGAIDQSETPTLTCSTYDVLPGAFYDASDPHASTDWQISASNIFASTTVQSVSDAANKVSWTVPAGNLVVGATYYARCRHRSSSGLVSAWSATVSFTTAASWGPAIRLLPSIHVASVAASNDGRTWAGATNTAARSMHAIPANAKTYFEVTVDSGVPAGSSNCGVGICTGSHDLATSIVATANSYALRSDGLYYTGTSSSAVGAGPAYVNGSKVRIAVNTVAWKWWFAVDNGAWNGDPAAGTGGVSLTVGKIYFAFTSRFSSASYASQFTVNFGHAAFAYTAPTGFSAGPGEYVMDGDVDAVFRSVLYTGTGMAKTVFSGVDISGSADGLVWIKNRSAANGHALFDSVRGETKYLTTNDSLAQVTAPSGGYLTSLSSGAFTIAPGVTNMANVGMAGEEYQAFIFKKAIKFFDVVSYTGNGANRSIAHSLGAAPGMILVKDLSATNSWIVYHSANGYTNYATLNTTNAFAPDSTFWNAAPSTTHFSVGAAMAVNANGNDYVAYLFAHDTASDSKIKCGSWTGAGGAQDVTVGWPVQWLLIKDTSDNTTRWLVLDLTGGGITFGDDQYICANETGGVSFADIVAPTPTGFRVVGSGQYTSGHVFAYVAIRRGPMIAVDKPTQVYQGVSYTGVTGARDIPGIGFRCDALLHHHNVAGYARAVNSIYVGRKSWLRANTNDPMQIAAGKIAEYYPDGVRDIDSLDMSGVASRIDAFRHMPGVFTSLLYRGTGANATVGHDLGVIPEMMIVKTLNSTVSWVVYHAALGGSKYLLLNLTNVEATDTTMWNALAPTAGVINVGGHSSVNLSGDTFLAMLFASKAGISKVGNFTTDGSGNATVTCGFRSRFIMVKSSSVNTSNWVVWNSEMGISDSASPSAENCLYLNTTDPEIAIGDRMDTTSTGFVVKSFGNPNTLYVYLAIA